MKSINHNIAKFLRIIGMIVFASAVVWLILLLIFCTGCRSVQKTQSIEKEKIDSLVTAKHDSTYQQTTTDFFKAFSAKNFKIKIVFDSGKIAQGIIPKKKTTTISSSFIESLVNIAGNQPVQSIELSADDLADSTHELTTKEKTTVNNDTTTRVNKNLKIKNSNKQTNSGSNILWVLGSITAVVIMFFAVFKSATKKVDVITAGIEKIEKL